MGLKTVELVKSILLTFLVLLSLVLTFSIWSYTPNLQIIEEKPVNQIKLGTDKVLSDVVKPYRVIFSDDEGLRGTIGSEEIDELLSTLANWKSSEVGFIQGDLSSQMINNMINDNQQVTLFYDAEVPLSIFNTLHFLIQNEVPNASFNRLIIDWSNLSAENRITVNFVSTNNGTIYNTDFTINSNHFINTIIQPSKSFGKYEEIERTNELSLYVPKDPIELLNLTYFIGEIHPDRFKDILFIEPSIVARNIESASSERYIDGMAVMTVDTNTRIINYVYPASESINEISSTKLLKDSYEFVNDHGGFTGDYRFKVMNKLQHVVEYQLYLQGLPVFSSMTTTKISTTWGDNQIFRYRRPYYYLDANISSEKNIVQLPSGDELIESIKRSKNINLESLDEIYLGYYFSQRNENESVYNLEPSWFGIINGNWVRLTPEMLGGDEYGLE